MVKPMRRLAVLVIFSATASALGAVQGISLDDGFGARVIGMGSAFLATGTSAESADGNPATMTLVKAYQLNIDGAWDASSKAGYAGTTLRDSSTSTLAAGVDYHLISTGRGGNRETSNLSTLSLALPVANALSLGLSGRYLLRTASTDRANAITMTAGAAVKFGEAVVLTVGAHNLIATLHPELPRFYSAGLGLNLGALVADVDLRSQLSDGFKPTVNVGGEYAINNVIPVRVGYQVDTRQSAQFFSGGLGFTSQGIGIDLAYRHQLQGGSSDLLVLSLRGQF
jgi:hypothetical protein